MHVRVPAAHQRPEHVIDQKGKMYDKRIDHTNLTCTMPQCPARSRSRSRPTRFGTILKPKRSWGETWGCPYDIYPILPLGDYYTHYMYVPSLSSLTSYLYVAFS
jgi:hypothetical protein